MTDHKVDYERYENERINNERIFLEMLKRMDPELYVFKDMLITTGLNIHTFYKVVPQLYNLAIGTKWGQVTIHVENGIVKFVRGEESLKVEEPLIIKKENDQLTTSL